MPTREKRLCLACEQAPAKRLDTTKVHYEMIREDPVFCSRGCAADWALNHIATMAGPPYWCSASQTWNWLYEGDACYACEGFEERCEHAHDPEMEQQELESQGPDEYGE